MPSVPIARVSSRAARERAAASGPPGQPSARISKARFWSANAARIAVGEALGGKPAKFLDAAAAMELIHTSSLILDDLPAMDDAMLRRGSPALHRQFGEDLAILAAVALLNHGYGLVSANHQLMRPRRWPAAELIQRVVDAVGWDGTIAGESVDLHSEGSTLDFDTLEFIHSRKTGALFMASAAIGAESARAQPGELAAVVAYAKNLGLAFQIVDDLIDVTGGSEAGKDTGQDVKKTTFVSFSGVEGARALAGELAAASRRALEPFGARAQPLAELARYVVARRR